LAILQSLPTTLEQYKALDLSLAEMSEAERFRVYWVLARADLYFLLSRVLSTSKAKREDGSPLVEHPWLLSRCRDVQQGSNETLDIWARYHFKSTIKTFAELIRQLLIDPDKTFGILSHTRPIAKSFLRQVKHEYESNELLRALSYNPTLGAPSIWDNTRQAPKWSEDEGLVLRRPGNPKEASIEAWGLVDSLPASKHYDVRLYDDVVTEDSITSPEMIEKTTRAWELSLNLGKPGGEEWYCGTFYGHGDTYTQIADRGYGLRLYPCYEIDEEKTERDPRSNRPVKLAWHMDRPVLYTAEHLSREAQKMGPRTFGIQMLCDVSAGLHFGFNRKDVRYYEKEPWQERHGKPRVILVDPANEKKKGSAYTSMWVIGLGSDGNFYVLDMVRDKLNLTERARALFRLHRQWKPVQVRYERYGLQADVQHIEYLQEQQGYRFAITEVGGHTRKDDRIARLLPLFTANRVWFPEKGIHYVNAEKVRENLVDTFMNDEFLVWPNGVYRDMLDSLARLEEPELPLPWPIGDNYWDDAQELSKWDKAWNRLANESPRATWMGT
jgi:predicted phage terminase large subunit-like protein